MSRVDHQKNIIEFEGICFAYDREPVLKDISLAIHQGDYMGIVGPNGGGKTTLLKIMLGLLKPDKGTVKLFGQDIRVFKDWSKIGYVPQRVSSFDPRFPATVLEVVSMGLFAKVGVLRRLGVIEKAKAMEALKKVGMQDFAHRLIGDLSGGQQQRVFIARALVANPEVIVLDEPTTGVDAENQKSFYDLLRRLNRQEELTLILVSHDSEVIEQESTEIATVNGSLTYQVNYSHV